MILWTNLHEMTSCLLSVSVPKREELHPFVAMEQKDRNLEECVI